MSSEEVPRSELFRWGDSQQYLAEPMPEEAKGSDGKVRPTVTLLSATSDPLGVLAAIVGVYEGRITRSVSEITDDQRREALEAMQATVLDGALEAIQFTFLIEGVSRDFTHQAVRNRFSFFAQESLRFAVPENWAHDIPYPPSLARDDGTHEMELNRVRWKDALADAQFAYERLVNSGVPAEEARKLLPHAILTRYYWVVSLRTLLQEAGKRTCTQAQFDWRLVMAGVAKALRDHRYHQNLTRYRPDGRHEPVESSDGWQFKAFADLIRPVCYQEGKCGFMAKFDRGCTIRERVDANAAMGRPSSEWHTDSSFVGSPGHTVDSKGRKIAKAIDPAEWAADPGAARL